MTDWLLRLARRIVGRDRSEWADAMAAEADAAGAHSTGWAWGCLTASLQDRLARERSFLLSILLLPIAAMIFTIVLFFAVAWLWRNAGLPGIAYSAILASAPIPFAYYLGTARTERSAMLAAMICFLVYQSIPMILTWAQFGKFFVSNSSVYGLPGLSGYGLGLLVWLVGAWWGSSRQSRASLT